MKTLLTFRGHVPFLSYLINHHSKDHTNSYKKIFLPTLTFGHKKSWIPIFNISFSSTQLPLWISYLHTQIKMINEYRKKTFFNTDLKTSDSYKNKSRETILNLKCTLSFNKSLIWYLKFPKFTDNLLSFKMDKKKLFVIYVNLYLI